MAHTKDVWQCERASRINSFRCAAVSRAFFVSNISNSPLNSSSMEKKFFRMKDKRFQWLEWVELCWTEAHQFVISKKFHSIVFCDKLAICRRRAADCHIVDARRLFSLIQDKYPSHIGSLKDITLRFKLLPKLFNFYVKIMDEKKINESHQPDRWGPAWQRLKNKMKWRKWRDDRSVITQRRGDKTTTKSPTNEVHRSHISWMNMF